MIPSKKVLQMNTAIVLAMHGVPPEDIPKRDVLELFRLHSMIEYMPQAVDDHMKKQFQELDSKIRKWPRTEDNDPYWAASYRLASKLEDITEKPVFVGFNEFCAPSLNSAFASAIEKGAQRIIIITTMMTKGGEHSEKDIPEAIEKAKDMYPDVEFQYAWPFDEKDVASFLMQHLTSYL